MSEARSLIEEFWLSLEHQQEWLEEPQRVDDSVYKMRTQLGYIFDDSFWEVFHGFPLRICHVAYYGPERFEDEDHKRPYVGVFELRFALAESREREGELVAALEAQKAAHDYRFGPAGEEAETGEEINAFMYKVQELDETAWQLTCAALGESPSRER